jgi:hypothetical protein
LQQAADILGVTVPFFFEGATGGTYKPDDSAPSRAYVNEFVSSEDGVRLIGRLQATMASEMVHKFKIGQTVNYHPKDRMLSTARGTYTVTGLMPALDGQQREYRIRHFSEEFERVAFENELSAEP